MTIIGKAFYFMEKFLLLFFKNLFDKAERQIYWPSVSFGSCPKCLHLTGLAVPKPGAKTSVRVSGNQALQS